MSCCCEFQLQGCNNDANIVAVIFDLDGTLLDTERATRGVLSEFLGKYGKELNREREENKRLGLTQKESAAFIVRDYQLPLTPDQFIKEINPLYIERWRDAKALPGANRIIKHLAKNGVPMALASNSSTEYIYAKISHHKGWKESFSVILGNDQVKFGKPAPDLVGVRAATAAKTKVVAVPSRGESDCCKLANVTLNSLLEFQPEIWGLPPFDDWISNTLPIEPIHLSGLYATGSLFGTTENATFAIPDQVVGIYFGWAKVDSDRKFKILSSINLDFSSVTYKKIDVWLIDANTDLTSEQKMQICLVGYIRSWDNKKLGSMEMDKLEEYKSTAKASLDLPSFSNF